MKNIIEPWKKIENPRYRLRCIENFEKYLHKHGKELKGYALEEKFKLQKELGGVTHLYLHRFASAASGTFGVLTLDNKPIAVTCEDPWNDNKVGESCIPEGTYTCLPHSGEKYKNVWQLRNVPNRTAILIHNGNTIKDTQGCILVGGALGYVVGRPAILNSKKKLTELQAMLPKEFTITINSLKG